MRNGLAASVFILGLASIYQRRKSGWPILFLATGIHSSMIFPLLIFLFAKRIRSIAFLLIIWLCILFLTLPGIISIKSIAGNFISYGGRITYILNYLVDTASDKSAAVRNYFLYGIPPLAIGFWYILKRKYDDFYLRVYKTYVMLSSFYLLVIDIRFSIRFAYLADFLMPVIIAYPLAKFYTNRIRFFYFGCAIITVFLVKTVVFR
jgi:hypothetical protein